MECIFPSHSLVLANLVPDIIRAIVYGGLPDGFTFKRLRRSIPDDQEKHRRVFGFL